MSRGEVKATQRALWPFCNFPASRVSFSVILRWEERSDYLLWVATIFVTVHDRGPEINRFIKQVALKCSLRMRVGIIF